MPVRVPCEISERSINQKPVEQKKGKTLPQGNVAATHSSSGQTTFPANGCVGLAKSRPIKSSVAATELPEREKYEETWESPHDNGRSKYFITSLSVRTDNNSLQSTSKSLIIESSKKDIAKKKKTPPLILFLYYSSSLSKKSSCRETSKIKIPSLPRSSPPLSSPLTYQLSYLQRPKKMSKNAHTHLQDKDIDRSLGRPPMNQSNFFIIHY